VSEALSETVEVDGLQLPALWLRDWCGCEECRDAFSGQRLQSVLSLDPHIRVERLEFEDDDVVVTFRPDGHVGRYSRAWLAANAPGRTRVFDDRSEAVRSPWTGEDLAAGPPTIAWAEFHDRGRDFADATRSLFDLGLLLVGDVPT
jgi:gamma-butyrobetaine dioxygenase